MDTKKKYTRTIVIRITEMQYKKLLDSINLIPDHFDNLTNNKSKVIREILDTYTTPKMTTCGKLY